jgi:hypothetical protein
MARIFGRNRRAIITERRDGAAMLHAFAQEEPYRTMTDVLSKAER